MAWWPWRRAGEQPASVAPVPPAAPGRSERPAPRTDWVGLPPVQRTLDAPLRPVAPLDVFRAGLATSRDPSFLTPLTHAVDPSAGGLVEGLASHVPGHAQPYASGQELAVPARPTPKPVVQRRAVSWPSAEPASSSAAAAAPEVGAVSEVGLDPAAPMVEPEPEPEPPADVVTLLPEVPGVAGDAGAVESSIALAEVPHTPVTGPVVQRSESSRPSRTLPVVASTLGPRGESPVLPVHVLPEVSAPGALTGPAVQRSAAGPARSVAAVTSPAVPERVTPSASEPSVPAAGGLPEPEPARPEPPDLPVAVEPTVEWSPEPAGAPLSGFAAAISALTDETEPAAPTPPRLPQQDVVSAPVMASPVIQRSVLPPPTGTAPTAPGPAGSALIAGATPAVPVPAVPAAPAVPGLPRQTVSVAAAPAVATSSRVPDVQRLVGPGTPAGQVARTAEVQQPLELRPLLGDAPPQPVAAEVRAVSAAGPVVSRSMSAGPAGRGGHKAWPNGAYSPPSATDYRRAAATPTSFAQMFASPAGSSGLPLQREVVLDELVVEPQPGNPAPSNPAPSNPAPSNPALVTPAPTNPAPTNPAPSNVQPAELPLAEPTPPPEAQAPDSAANPEPLPPSSGTGPGGAAPAPAAGAGVSAADLEEMARRLYEPLSARLRAELWLDRERAGI